MRVLVACEWSNTVRDVFLARGHDAFSCDLIRAEHPNTNHHRHILGDVTPILRESWDLVIAHPPCTYLCNSGVHWLSRRKGRYYDMLAAVSFFKRCLEANAPMVCVENPIMHGYARSALQVEPTQMIQPHEHGHPCSKATYLWLKGLPKLVPTMINHERINTKHGLMRDSKERSRTFSGIAQAMADQWG